MDFSYFEPKKALRIRIEAHQKFAGFSLEDFLRKTFDFKHKSVLDIGCGDGNLTGILSEKAGLYAGIEKNKDLIEAAWKKNQRNNAAFFLNRDMDEELYFPDSYFNLIFFVFSSYYTNKALSLFKRCKRLLQTGGEIVLIGPTKNNAKEIEDFCSLIFKKNNPSKLRARRIESEFQGILKKLGMQVKLDTHTFNLKFPTVDLYMKYVRSTLQFRDSFNGAFDEKKARELLQGKYSLVLTKEIVCLRAKK